MNFLLLEKLQGFVDILQAVNTHAAFGGPWLWEAEGKEALVLKWLTKRNHATFRHGPEGKKKQNKKTHNNIIEYTWNCKDHWMTLVGLTLFVSDWTETQQNNVISCFH